MNLSDVEWKKSTYTGDDGGNCVEVAEVNGTINAPEHKTGHAKLIAVRDSKNPDGPVLYFTQAEWDAFVAGVKDNEFDID